MAVKKKDRSVSKNDVLNKARSLVMYTLVLIHPREFDKDGKQIRKPGILGEGQPLQAFGLDIFKCGRRIHAACYQASKIYLKDEQTLKARRELYDQALENCRVIFQLIDLCIVAYAQNNKAKRRSFAHLGYLTKEVKDAVDDRKNRDILIYNHEYSPSKHKFRR